MPIFMDRHELAGVSAADIAAAHLKDIDIQDRYGVRFLTYWFDERRGTAFCLMDAPDAETAQYVHREAHGFVASEVVEVALSAVEAFLGRIQDPTPLEHAPKHMDAGHRAILFTDIVGSTEMTARLGDRMAAKLVRAHDALVRGCLVRRSGREVKHTGDGIMAVFSSTPLAVDCAIDIQRAFHRYNSDTGEPIHIRIGLDCGEPIEDSNDFFGTTVQLAARLCAAADSDQILISNKTLQEYGSADVPVYGHRYRLKGFAKPVLAYRCEWLH